MSKQYLLMVDDAGKERFTAMFRGDIQFLEVNGMNIGDNNAFKVLVSPVPPPVPPMPASAFEAATPPAQPPAEPQVA